ETIEMTLGITVFHCELPSLAIAEVAHPEQKLTAQVCLNRIRWRSRFEVTHAENVRLLRLRRERPRCSRAAERDYQFPPSDGDCHTPLPCEVRKWNDSTPRVRSLHVQGGQNAGCCRPASGSKAERLSFSLCPRKRTSSYTTGMSA